MKTGYIFLLLSCISFIIRAQDCSKSYYFKVDDKTTFATSCGEVEADGWRVSKNSCNFYSPLTNIPDEDEGKWIDIRAVFSGSDNLDARDFVWIFYYTNGNTSKTSTIKGEPGQTKYEFRDSILVPPGGSYRFRIAMVSDEADEYWGLGTENFSICERAKAGDKIVEQIPEAGKIFVTRERGIVKLNWDAVSADNANYFKIERSGDGEKFEFAGYVKENNPANKPVRYAFIDAGSYPEQTWYRIKQVDINGAEINFGEITAVKL